MIRLINRLNREEEKEKLILAAFIGFQLGAAGKGTFGDYLKRLKLSDEDPQSAGSRDKAGDIMMLARMGIVEKKVGADN